MKKHAYILILEADGASAMLKKGADSFSIFSRTGCLLPWSVHSKFRSQSTLSPLRDSTERGLSREIQGKLCFPRITCLFQLVSDWQLLVRGNNLHQAVEITFSYKESKQINKQMKMIRLKAHLFGNRKESQDKLEKAIDTWANYKEESLTLTNLAAVFMHPPAQKKEANLPFLSSV